MMVSSSVSSPLLKTHNSTCHTTAKQSKGDGARHDRLVKPVEHPAANIEGPESGSQGSCTHLLVPSPHIRL